MNRRQRKKKRIGEFQEMGFEVSYELSIRRRPSQIDAFLDSFVKSAIEANDLAVGGGGHSEMSFFVTSAKRRGGASELQRAAVKAWLSSQDDVLTFQVGPLRDAWYGHAQPSVPPDVPAAASRRQGRE